MHIKHYLPAIIFFVCSAASGFAQKDTSIYYINHKGIQVAKENSFIYTKAYKNGSLWHGTTYYTSNNVLQSDGDFLDSACTIATGSFKNYNEKGILDNISVYNNGKLTEQTCYYKSGAKKSDILLNADGTNVQKAWDENGNEMKGYIVFKKAAFKGGESAWVKYLEKHSDKNIATESGAAPGQYTVTVEFWIDKDGTIINAKAISIPDKCKPCATAAVSQIMDAPAWDPAIENNEPAVYHCKENISFQIK
jgi:hypothetical protein